MAREQLLKAQEAAKKQSGQSKPGAPAGGNAAMQSSERANERFNEIRKQVEQQHPKRPPAQFPPGQREKLQEQIRKSELPKWVNMLEKAIRIHWTQFGNEDHVRVGLRYVSVFILLDLKGFECVKRLTFFFLCSLFS